MPPLVRQGVFIAGVLLLILSAAIVWGAGGILGDTATELAGSELRRPGIGIRMSGLVSILLAFSLVLMLLDPIPVWQKIAPRLLGIFTLIVMIIGIILTLIAVLAALQLLLLMISLLLATPFGTIAYLALWGDFDTDASRKVLGLVMLLQVVGAILVLVVNPSLLKNIFLLLLFASALGITFLLGFLHALPPSFLVSITDAIGGIVAGILAAIWMIVFLLGSLPAILRAIRSVLPG
jgi:hypothetical protein